MKDLITLTERVIAQYAQQTVNARDLHAFLEVGKDFSTWIKKRIDDYGFVENQDYTTVPQKNGTEKSSTYDDNQVFPKTGENPQGGRPKIDYHITLDMAKELAMVERNEKGREARRYFIECEKRLHAQTLPPVAEDKRLRAEAMNMNARTRQFKEIHRVLDKVGDKLSTASLETLLITSAEKLLDTQIDYRPVIRPTFSATEIGHQLGISAHKVGKLANEYGLKTNRYGMTVLSKSRHSDRQVSTFVYYTEVLPTLRQILAQP